MTQTRVTVLVVDDNPEFLDVVRRILATSQPPFDVRTVETGREALELLDASWSHRAASAPTFVLLDFHLPDMKAPAVLRHWRGTGVLEGLPVLVLSQADWAGDEAEVLAAGATLFRVKPSQPQALRDIVVDFWREHVDGEHAIAKR